MFGPVKYAILPQHLAETELLLGTGLVEGATFVAILLGQIAGGLLPRGWAGPVAIGVAVLGWLTLALHPAGTAIERHRHRLESAHRQPPRARRSLCQPRTCHRHHLH